MKTDKFFIQFLNFPVKEIITNWIDELLGLAAALVSSLNLFENLRSKRYGIQIFGVHMCDFFFLAL